MGYLSATPSATRAGRKISPYDADHAAGRIIYTCNPHPDFQHQVEKIAKETPLVIISNKEKTTTVDAINQDNTV